MATRTKKAAKKPKAKPRSVVAKKSQPKKTGSTQDLQRELADALARENATSDILRMIAKAPGDLQAVLDALAESQRGCAMPRMRRFGSPREAILFTV